MARLRNPRDYTRVAAAVADRIEAAARFDARAIDVTGGITALPDTDICLVPTESPIVWAIRNNEEALGVEPPVREWVALDDRVAGRTSYMVERALVECIASEFRARGYAASPVDRASATAAYK